MPYMVPNLSNTFPTKNIGPHLFSILSHGTLSKLHSTDLRRHIKSLLQKQSLSFGAPTYDIKMIEANSNVNTSGKAGAQIIHLPLGDDSSSSGDSAVSR
jgi:hypothetical protein